MWTAKELGDVTERLLRQEKVMLPRRGSWGTARLMQGAAYCRSVHSCFFLGVLVRQLESIAYLVVMIALKAGLVTVSGCVGSQQNGPTSAMTALHASAAHPSATRVPRLDEVADPRGSLACRAGMNRRKR